jgi:hypothetical protein
MGWLSNNKGLSVVQPLYQLSAPPDRITILNARN